MATEEKQAVARSHRLNLIRMRKACSPTEGHTLLPMSQNDASQRSYNVQRDSNTIMALQAHALRHNTPDAAMNEWLKVGGWTNKNQLFGPQARFGMSMKAGRCSGDAGLELKTGYLHIITSY